MDLGVIRSLKAKYRKKYNSKDLRSLEKNEDLPIISILSGMQMLASAQSSVSIKTIVRQKSIVTIFVRQKSVLQIKKQLQLKRMIHSRICRMRLMTYETFNQILYQRMSTHLHELMLTLKLYKFRNFGLNFRTW